MRLKELGEPATGVDVSQIRDGFRRAGNCRVASTVRQRAICSAVYQQLSTFNQIFSSSPHQSMEGSVSCTIAGIGIETTRQKKANTLQSIWFYVYGKGEERISLIVFEREVEIAPEDIKKHS
eukprot:TRINITY_DN4382_c0_g1_i1.p2 TRINITY_DN4382_c0_g1~~TRINITY_DN4382_c0_g1_i1.p2  ORF type:complete len:122 (+),score=10.59 TRINITY_DN4382_c0_g1_i1:155-520(+)